jgi:HK97 family phage major capsid protein
MLYVKNEKGELVLASPADIANGTIALYNEDGTIAVPTAESEKPVGKKDVNVSTPSGDWTKQLAGAIREMSGDFKALKDEVAEKVHAFEDMASRGFPMPGAKGAPEPDLTSGTYNLARQGQDLVRKYARLRARRPDAPELKEEDRQSLAKYFTLFIRASHMGDQDAKREFAENYGSCHIDANGARRKTNVGDTGNAFPLPDELMDIVLTFARESSIVLQDARTWPMGSDKLSFPVETAGSDANWGNTSNESDPTVGECELSADELSAIVTVKNTTIDDSRIDITSWLTEMLSESAGKAIDDAGFNGDGTSTYGGCYGMLGTTCGFSVVMGAGSTAFSNINIDFLSEMISKLEGRRKEGAGFYGSGTVLHYLRIMKDTNGNPVMTQNFADAFPYRVLGFPFREAIKITGTSASNTAFLLFGNMQYFFVGRRLDTTALQTNPFAKWSTNRTQFKIYQRWALKMALANGFVRGLTNS